MGSIRGVRAHDDALLTLTIGRPPGNVFTAELMRDLTRHIHEAAGLPRLRLIVLQAEGEHFSYGAAVAEHTPDRVGQMLPVLRELVMAIASSPVPVAALVQGMCLGGAFEVVLACHFLFAARGARFALPEIRLGVFPPVAAALLPRRTSQALAERMILSGEELLIADLRRAGLIHTAAPADELRARVEAWFEATLKRFSAASLREAVHASRQRLLAGLEEELIKFEQDYLKRLARVRDADEGIHAFIERRNPQWSHA
jgi:cyclohexa-1,5-dienecarbonyl-CoA hydratase